MYLNQVEAFVNVVKYKSFSRAAQNMYVSQPTVSSYIKALEESLGVKLLERTTKDVELTDAGKAFYRHALQLLDARDISMSSVTKFAHVEPEELKIVVSSLSNWFHMPEAFIAALRNQPLLQFILIRKNSQGVLESVLNNDADFGLVASYSPRPELSFIPIFRERYILITPNTPYFASMKGVFPTELFQTEPFVVREAGSNAHDVTEQYLKSIGLTLDDLRVAMVTMNPESIQFMVKNKVGLAFINESAVQDYLDERYVLPFRIDSPILYRQLYVVYNNKGISDIAKTFIDTIKGFGNKQ